MKKSILLLSVLFVTMSSFKTSETVKSEEYRVASCFEQGHWYAQWWRSYSGGTAVQAARVALAYYNECEDARRGTPVPPANQAPAIRTI